MKRLLLLTTPYMDIYKDVQQELIRKGFIVDTFFCQEFKADPYNVRGYKKLRKLRLLSDNKFHKFNKKRWTKILASKEYCYIYDVLFVIDGQSIDSVVFSILKKRNPQLKSINYLFDTTSGVYRFDINFKYFDKIVTFDRAESKKFNIDFYPIFWVDEDSFYKDKHFFFFGLGRYEKNRYKLFKQLYLLSERLGKYSYIKLQTPPGINIFKYRLTAMLRRIFGLKKPAIPLDFFKNELQTTEQFTPKEFRQMIRASEIIIDSSAPHQDGLTARFMWALGAEKKIITTNQTVRNYDFYTEEQIFVCDDIENIDYKALMSFLNKSYFFTKDQRSLVSNYNISNWINYLIS